MLFQSGYNYVPYTHRRRRNQLFLYITIFVSIIALSSIYLNFFDFVTETISTLASLEASKSSSSGEHLTELDESKYNGRYPHSLLTLFYPYTLISDVVLAQPIPETDIPYFWHMHVSDEKAVKQILKKCYGLELIELNDKESIQKAIDLNLVEGLDRFKHVVTSPFIRETAEMFTTDHFGRMMCFVRHPIQYDLHPSLPKFERKDNYFVRMLSDWHTEDITLKQLGVAKHVFRELCVVGTLDHMEESIMRMAAYYGWEYSNDMDEWEGKQCINDALIGFPEELWANHDTDEWKQFYANNRYDCELYEIGQSAWRAQLQTAIPYEVQLQRDESEDEEEDDE